MAKKPNKALRRAARIYREHNEGLTFGTSGVLRMLVDTQIEMLKTHIEIAKRLDYLQRLPRARERQELIRALDGVAQALRDVSDRIKRDS